MITRRQFLLFMRVSLFLVVGAILISCGSIPTHTPAHATLVSQATPLPGATPQAEQTSAWIAADAHLHRTDFSNLRKILEAKT